MVCCFFFLIKIAWKQVLFRFAALNQLKKHSYLHFIQVLDKCRYSHLRERQVFRFISASLWAYLFALNFVFTVCMQPAFMSSRGLVHINFPLFSLFFLLFTCWRLARFASGAFNAIIMAYFWVNTKRVFVVLFYVVGINPFWYIQVYNWQQLILCLI